MVKTGWRFKFYPNGEFSGGYVADRGHDQKFKIDPNAFRSGSQWWSQCPELRRWVESKIVENGTDYFDIPPEEEYDEDGRPLEFTIPSNSHKRRGLNGITSRGQRLVRNTAFMLQRKYGRRCLSFLTLTVPPLGEAGELAVCSQWGEAIRLFCQWLRRELDRAGLPKSYVGVTEIQEKRWNERLEVGLHLHIVFVGRSTPRESWALSPVQVRERWLDVLTHITGSRVYSRSCENLKQVKDSASAYLGKYMSKGVRIVGEVAEVRGENYIPSAWYTCSQNLKIAYSKSIRMEWDEDIHIMSRLPLLSETGCITGVHIHTIEIAEREMLVGVSGRFYMPKLYRYANTLAQVVRVPGKHSEAYADKW